MRGIILKTHNRFEIKRNEETELPSSLDLSFQRSIEFAVFTKNLPKNRLEISFPVYFLIP